MKKAKEEILDQLYISAYDLQVLIPSMSYAKALEYIEKKREEMKEKNMYIPDCRTKLALTKMIRKDCGF